MKKLLTLALLVFVSISCQKKVSLNDYTIVIPTEATETETRAANELQRFLKQISGVELPIATDTTEADKEILIGNTRRSLPYDLPKLEEDGFIIRNSGNKLNIQGGTRKGTLYGVYALLEEYMGVRKYSPTVEVVPEQKDMRIPAKIENEQIPVIHERYGSDMALDTVTNDWFRRSLTPAGKNNFGLFVHTFDYLVPHELFEEHPEYFALVKGRRGKTQPCLTNPDVLEIVCQQLADTMSRNPDATFWSVSSNDNFQPCECDECAAIDEEEGSQAGSVIRFVNEVAKRFPDKTISTLGYQYTRKAPKTKPGPNVNIMFCSIECNRAEAIPDDPTSAEFCRDMEDWAALTDNIMVWDYSVSFNELQRPFPSWHTLQPNMQYFARHNVKQVFVQCAGWRGGELSELRGYMVSKLLWNPDLDFDAVMNDFLDNYYGAGGKYIRQYIDLICKNMRESGEWLHIHRYAIDHMDSWLSADKMNDYMALFDKAIEAVKDQPEVLERVKVARNPLYFTLMEISRIDPYGERGFLEETNGEWRTKPEWLAMLDEFYHYCEVQGVPRVTEHHSSPAEYREQMLHLADIQQKGNLAYRKPVTSNVPIGDDRNTRGQGLPVLTDGVRGTQIWISNWLGFYTPELELVVDLEKPETVRHVDSHHLQILWESAFMPERVEALLSTDGTNYRSVGVQRHTVTADPFYGYKQYAFDFPPTEARYVKLKINGLDLCPVWHYYSGDPALIFVDEIVVR